jgi:hypothetical protein
VTSYGDCLKLCEDFAPNVGDKRTGCYITKMHPLTLPFSPGNFLEQITLLSPSSTLRSSVSSTEDKTVRPPFWHNWGDGGRIADGSEHPHRTQLPGYIWKMAEVLETVHRRGEWWCPRGPKLIFERMAAPVPEIMDDSFYFFNLLNMLWKYASRAPFSSLIKLLIAW